jgi:hypothetical protein
MLKHIIGIQVMSTGLTINYYSRNKIVEDIKPSFYRYLQ